MELWIHSALGMRAIVTGENNDRVRVDFRPANRGCDARVLLDTAGERPMPELQRGYASNAVPRTRQMDALVSVVLVPRMRVERNASSRPGERNAGSFR